MQITITYTARASKYLQVGHTAGTDYTIQTYLEAFDFTSDIVSDSNTSLNGNLETTLQRIDEKINITTSWITDLAPWNEFLWSVANGSTFQLNWSSVDYTVKLISKTITPTRIDRSQNVYTLQMQVKII